MMTHDVRRDVDTNALDLEQTVTDTYFWLRWVTGVIALMLPVLLWAGGALIGHEPLKDSMSAYYFGNMHDWFVGLLFAVAAGLYLYEGLSDF